MSMQLKSFEFMLPTIVRFGPGVCEEIPGELKKRKSVNPMLITDKGLVNAGIVDQLLDLLRDNGYEEVPVFAEVEPNPRDTTVERAAALALDRGADCLLALGGGSAMDTAKAAGILMKSGGKVKDYEGLDKVPEKNPLLFAIPTTVGTGSEVTFWAVIKDTRENYKLSIGSPHIAPDIAFADPLLVSTLPPEVTAATGMDALTHAIEGYTCRVAEPVTDACGLYAIRLISRSLRDAVFTDNLEARANMLMGSLLAGICFGNSDVAACHCMSEALGGLYDTPHGVANALMLPYTMEFNYVSDLSKFSQIAEAMDVCVRNLSPRQGACASVEAVRELIRDLGIPNIRDIGAREEDIEELSMRSAGNVSAEDNPRPVTKEDFRRMFEAAFRDAK